MKNSAFLGVIIAFATSLFFGEAFSQVYEYRNAAGRLVKSESPPSGHDNAERRPVNRYKFIKSKEKTTEDIPLDFDIEKTEYRYGSLRIWGSVRGSKKKQSYEYVKVTFSLYGGRGGDLLAREYTFTDPKDIEPRGVGYIIDFGIKCDISKLNVVEYKVTGK